MSVSLYTMAVILMTNVGSSPRPVSVVVPNVSYDECMMHVNNYKLTPKAELLDGQCLLQVRTD